jgi:hypothetical protein
MFWKRSFKVKLAGRAGLNYEDEFHRKMFIDSEMLHSGDGDYGYDMVIYARSITSWLPPHDKEPVTTEERAVIKKNIEAWFKKGWFKPLRIDWQA